MRQPSIFRPSLLAGRAAVVAVMFVAVPSVYAACSDSTAPNVSTGETAAQVAARLQSMEVEKVRIAFGSPARTDAQVARFLGMFAPEFRSVNLGPTGATQSGYAELQAQIASFPAIPYTIGNVRALSTNDATVVVTYEVALQTPGGTVNYVASSVWARRAGGAWQTIWYQATPL